MKSLMTRLRSRFSARAACLVAVAFAAANSHAEWHPPSATAEELAVWQAVAVTVTSDNASSPYQLWYYQSDFTAASFIASAIVDPERKEFCGLSAAEVPAMISELKAVSATPVVLDSSVAKSSGFKITYTKKPQQRYFALSRVVFDPAHERAWLSVELNGERGHIARLDKVAGQWSRTSRCGAWYIPE